MNRESHIFQIYGEGNVRLINGLPTKLFKIWLFFGILPARIYAFILKLEFTMKDLRKNAAALLRIAGGAVRESFKYCREQIALRKRDQYLGENISSLSNARKEDWFACLERDELSGGLIAHDVREAAPVSAVPPKPRLLFALKPEGPRLAN